MSREEKPASFKKELFIVHFQQRFFEKIMEDKDLRKKILSEFTPLVNKMVDDPNTHISILEEANDFNPSGILSSFTKIKNLDPGKTDWFFAPAGNVLVPNMGQFRIHSNRIVFVGGWIGACLNFAIASAIVAFLTDEKLKTEKKLSLFLSGNSTYKKKGETMADLEIATTNEMIDHVFDATIDSLSEDLNKNGKFIYPEDVVEAGLTYTVLDDAHKVIHGPKEVLRPQNTDEAYEVTFFINP